MVTYDLYFSQTFFENKKKSADFEMKDGVSGSFLKW